MSDHSRNDLLQGTLDMLILPMGRKRLTEERASWTRMARGIELILQRSPT